MFFDMVIVEVSSRILSEESNQQSPIISGTSLMHFLPLFFLIKKVEQKNQGSRKTAKNDDFYRK
jgi:hypothetical protein